MLLLTQLAGSAALAADQAPPRGASLRVVVHPEPQAGCDVVLSGASDATGTTDAMGWTTLEELAVGEVHVSVTCPGREPVEIDSVFVVADRLCEIGVTPVPTPSSAAATVWMSRLGPWTGTRSTVLTRIFTQEIPPGRAIAGIAIGPPTQPNDNCGPP